MKRIWSNLFSDDATNENNSDDT